MSQHQTQPYHQKHSAPTSNIYVADLALWRVIDFCKESLSVISLWQPAKINFEIDCCRLKIWLAKIDFSYLIFPKSIVQINRGIDSENRLFGYLQSKEVYFCVFRDLWYRQTNPDQSLNADPFPCLMTSTICSTVELGVKELFGHHKIVP